MRWRPRVSGGTRRSVDRWPPSATSRLSVQSLQLLRQACAPASGPTTSTSSGYRESPTQPHSRPSKQVLVPAGHHPAPEAYPDITVPVLNAITRLGVATAVEFLDRVARERPYPGAQFLVDERDRLAVPRRARRSRSGSPARQRAGTPC